MAEITKGWRLGGGGWRFLVRQKPQKVSSAADSRHEPVWPSGKASGW